MKPREVKLGDDAVFVIRPWPTVTTFIMLCVLIGLGTWQIQRLHWKQDLLRTIDTRIHLAPIDVAKVTDPLNSEYLPITATGSFAPGQELHMHGISLKGEAGYHVLSPLKTGTNSYILVDRGFVPMDRLDPQSRPEGENYQPQTITGFLRLPHHHWMQPKDHAEANDWYGYNLHAMADNLGLPDFAPFVLESAVPPEAGVYPQSGQTRLDIPNNHLVYVIIWFSLAFALVIIYGVQGYRKIS